MEKRATTKEGTYVRGLFILFYFLPFLVSGVGADVLICPHTANPRSSHSRTLSTLHLLCRSSTRAVDWDWEKYSVPSAAAWEFAHEALLAFMWGSGSSDPVMCAPCNLFRRPIGRTSSVSQRTLMEERP